MRPRLSLKHLFLQCFINQTLPSQNWPHFSCFDSCSVKVTSCDMSGYVNFTVVTGELCSVIC